MALPLPIERLDLVVEAEPDGDDGDRRGGDARGDLEVRQVDDRNAPPGLPRLLLRVGGIAPVTEEASRARSGSGA